MFREGGSIVSEGVRPTGTYKTLDEQREVLSPAEQRFEKARQTIGLFLGPVVFLIMYFLPLPLERDQQTLAAILAFTIVYWLSEAIPIPATAILALALAVLLNVPALGPNAEDAPGDIIYGSFASDIIFLFIGAFIIAQAMVTHGPDTAVAPPRRTLPVAPASDILFLFMGAFIIAQAMVTHGLDRRFAFRILSLPGVSNSTYGVIIAFGAIAALLSSVISNPATPAMPLPP